MSEWQLIESAPKDGTEVLVTDGEVIWIGVHHPLNPVEVERQKAGWKVYPWIDATSETPIGGLTHWMPLPSLPTTGADT